MRKKNIFHNKIRIKKGKKGSEITSQIIGILNKKKTSSQGIVNRMGYFLQGKTKLFSLNFELLSHYLNKGFIMNMSVKKLIQKKILYATMLKKKKT